MKLISAHKFHLRPSTLFSFQCFPPVWESLSGLSALSVKCGALSHNLHIFAGTSRGVA